MGIVINFPSTSNADALTRAMSIVSATYRKAGLNDTEISNAISELRQTVEPLFHSQSIAFTFPSEIGLNQYQVDAIGDAVENCFIQAAAKHAENIAYAVNVIAGLTASNVINRE